MTLTCDKNVNDFEKKTHEGHEPYYLLPKQ